ncbi:MAG: TraR/DksA family transcriptional regulator [Pirellulaceae bacterium]
MNDIELAQYRERLLELRGRLTSEINQMADSVRRDESPDGEHDRLASEPIDKEVVIDKGEEAIRRDVMQALRRIDDGIYGLCQHCREPIAPLRLEAMPHAPYCVECERQRESGEWE